MLLRLLETDFAAKLGQCIFPKSPPYPCCSPDHLQVGGMATLPQSLCTIWPFAHVDRERKKERKATKQGKTETTLSEALWGNRGFSRGRAQGSWIKVARFTGFKSTFVNTPSFRQGIKAPFAQRQGFCGPDIGPEVEPGMKIGEKNQDWKQGKPLFWRPYFIYFIPGPI